MFAYSFTDDILKRSLVDVCQRVKLRQQERKQALLKLSSLAAEKEDCIMSRHCDYHDYIQRNAKVKLPSIISLNQLPNIYLCLIMLYSFFMADRCYVKIILYIFIYLRLLFFNRGSH